MDQTPGHTRPRQASGCRLATRQCLEKREWGEKKLTVLPAVDAADGRDGRAAGDDELVGGARLVRRARLGHHEVVEVEPEEN